MDRGPTAWKAPTRAVAEQPVPVTQGMSECPPSMTSVRRPSVTRSVGPVMARVVPSSRARAPAALAASSMESVESTPLVAAFCPARDRISEALPRTTLTFVQARMDFAVSVRRGVAPEPTGSRMMGLPSAVALRPALSMAATQTSVSVPMFSTSAPA